jgi:hypothetical protein
MCCSTKFPGGSVGNIKESTVKKEQKKENWDKILDGSNDS